MEIKGLKELWESKASNEHEFTGLGEMYGNQNIQMSYLHSNSRESRTFDIFVIKVHVF